MTDARPFIKWAGGKAKLAERIVSLFPAGARCYHEPFLGAGAVFWHAASPQSPCNFEGYLLSDVNAELINLWRHVRGDPVALCAKATGWGGDAGTYSAVRAATPPEYTLDAAARMLYLNYRGFNGLYRVNRKGQFNVPYGKYTRTPLDDPEKFAARLQACSDMLRTTEPRLAICDFRRSIELCRRGDVAYADPPYAPLSDTANFTSYTAGGFGWPEQVELADALAAARDRGVFVVTSNAGTYAVHRLYEERGFTTETVRMRRNINAKRDGRGPVGEMLAVGRPA